jgi:hypothetical protein
LFIHTKVFYLHVDSRHGLTQIEIIQSQVLPWFMTTNFSS